MLLKGLRHVCPEVKWHDNIPEMDQKLYDLQRWAASVPIGMRQAWAAPGQPIPLAPLGYCLPDMDFPSSAAAKAKAHNLGHNASISPPTVNFNPITGGLA